MSTRLKSRTLFATLAVMPLFLSGCGIVDKIESLRPTSGSTVAEESTTQAESEFIYPWVVDTMNTGGDGGYIGDNVVFIYTYDELGRLTEINSNGVPVMDSSEPLNGLESRTDVITYDANNRLASIETNASSGDYTFSYDTSGRLVTSVGRDFYTGRFEGPNFPAGEHVTTTTYTYGKTDKTKNRIESYAAHIDMDHGRGVKDKFATITYEADGLVLVDDGTNSHRLTRDMCEVKSGPNDDNPYTRQAEYDDKGNLIRFGDETYTYKQIKVRRDSWHPNHLTNPSMRSQCAFLFDITPEEEQRIIDNASESQ